MRIEPIRGISPQGSASDKQKERHDKLRQNAKACCDKKKAGEFDEFLAGRRSTFTASPQQMQRILAIV